MCLKIDAKLARDYTISILGGLAASLVVVFALKDSSSILSGVFYFYLVILYVVGLFVAGIFNGVLHRKK